MKDKEMALADMIKGFTKSWTFNRLTDEEKSRFHKIFNAYDADRYIQGNYRQRCQQLHGMYHAFLLGVGYDNSVTWRGDETEPLF